MKLSVGKINLKININMNTLKQILFAALVLGAANANAAYSISSVSLATGGNTTGGTGSYSQGGNTYTAGNTYSGGTYVAGFFAGSAFPADSHGGVTGQSIFNVNVTGSGSTTGWTLTATPFEASNDANFDLNSISIAGLAPSTQFLETGNHTYAVTVGWTITGVNGSYPNWLQQFNLELGSGLSHNGSQVGPTSFSSADYITAVPEPGQTVAGAAILGCGFVGFVGRRFLKKQQA